MVVSFIDFISLGLGLSLTVKAGKPTTKSPETSRVRIKKITGKWKNKLTKSVLRKNKDLMYTSRILRVSVRKTGTFTTKITNGCNKGAWVARIFP